MVIFIIVLLAVLTWGGYRYRLYRTLRTNIHQETLAADKTMVELGAHYIAGSQIQTLNTLTLAAGEVPFGQELFSGLDNKTAIQLETLAARLNCDLLMVLDPTGSVLWRWSAPDMPTEDELGLTRIYKNLILSTKPISISTEVDHRGQRTPVMVLASPILDRQTRKAGFLIAVLGPTRWREFLVGMTNSHGEYAFFLFSDHGIIAQSRPDQEWAAYIGRRVTETPLVGEPSFGFSELVGDIDSGEPFFLSTARVPELGWTLALAHDYRKVMAPMEAMLRNISIFMALLLLLLGGDWGGDLPSI